MTTKDPLQPAAALTSEAKSLATEATALTDKATALADKVAPAPIVTAASGQVLPPKTTAESDRATYGQRRINLIWESTQAVVALSVTLSTLYVSASLAMSDESQTAAFLLLSNVFFLVVGTYFQRTNHTKVGGVSPQDHRGER